MKVPKPRKLPSGNWFIQLRLDGNSIPITASTRTECINLAELTKAEYRAGKKTALKTPRETTLQDAFDKFIAANKATLSPSTVRSYTIYSKKRFPEYRNKKLPQIEWQEMIDAELKIVSEKTVKNAWGLVTSSLKHVEYPVPKVRLSPAPINEIPFLQPEEIASFCEAIKGRSYEIAALLELHGLRLSEVKGLDWSNVDLKKNVITVKGAQVRSLDGDVMKPTNKNKTSTRPVPIMIPQLRDALNAVPDKTGAVVTIKGGTLLDDIKRACERAGVTVVSNHGLRHSFASLCFFLEIPERQIQEWGGWKDSVVLHRIYIRLAASMQSDNQKTFTRFFKEKKKRKSKTSTLQKNQNANENANNS